MTDALTLEKELKDQKDKMDAILSSMSEGLIAFNGDMKVTIMNQAASILLRVASQDAFGHDIHEVLRLYQSSTKVGEAESPVTKAMESGVFNVRIVDDYYMEDKNGKKIPISLSAAILLGKSAPEGLKGVVMFKDVTADKAVDRAKSEFVSLASHQLRTPLSAISWYTEMLLAGDAGALTEDQRKYLQEVYTGNQRMVDLVNALLNVSRLELGTFIIEPKPTDVLVMVKSVVGEMTSLITEKKITITESYAPDIPPFLADEKLLRMVFQNLLSNAVKYTGIGGRVTLTLGAYKGGGMFSNRQLLEDTLAFSVTDSGIGIPQYQQTKIFSKLFRADNAKESETEGTGLGLYIIKSIVDHSGGRIWFNSEETKGTSFYVTFPLSGMKKKEGTRALG